MSEQPQVDVMRASLFVVVMVRMIGSVVSKDEPYQGFFSSIREIYSTEGFSGFFWWVCSAMA